MDSNPKLSVFAHNMKTVPHTHSHEIENEHPYHGPLAAPICPNESDAFTHHGIFHHKHYTEIFHSFEQT